jgi:hypothetical protein
MNQQIKSIKKDSLSSLNLNKIPVTVQRYRNSKSLAEQALMQYISSPEYLLNSINRLRKQKGLMPLSTFML